MTLTWQAWTAQPTFINICMHPCMGARQQLIQQFSMAQFGINNLQYAIVNKQSCGM
jgi:hypothetical protein